jgi:hypothetical protein
MSDYDYDDYDDGGNDYGDYDDYDDNLDYDDHNDYDSPGGSENDDDHTQDPDDNSNPSGESESDSEGFEEREGNEDSSDGAENSDDDECESAHLSDLGYDEFGRRDESESDSSDDVYDPGHWPSASVGGHWPSMPVGEPGLPDGSTPPSPTSPVQVLSPEPDPLTEEVHSRVETILTSKQALGKLLKAKGTTGQQILDILQKVLDLNKPAIKPIMCSYHYLSSYWIT